MVRFLIFFVLYLLSYKYHTQKQRKIKIESWIKVNHKNLTFHVFFFFFWGGGGGNSSNMTQVF